jgi:hypothetical protein
MKTPIVVRVNKMTIFHPPLNICVSTCPHYPNEEVQNIWEGLGTISCPLVNIKFDLKV